MDKGYYLICEGLCSDTYFVAIHNKNGQGLLLTIKELEDYPTLKSQSTIKMDKGYYPTTAKQ